MDKSENIRMATIEEQRDNWKESARFHLKNEEYYRKERDTMATENARLLAALNIATPALEAAMGMLSDDDAMPFVRTLGYCALLLEDATEYNDDMTLTTNAVWEELSAEVGRRKTLQAERDELRDVLSYFVCNFPAGTAKSKLFEDMFSRGMTLIGILPSDGDVSEDYNALACAVTHAEEQLSSAVDNLTLYEFQLPIWCWEATALYDRTFGDGPCTTEQPSCGPDQPLPF